MTDEARHEGSMLEDEVTARWGFLDEESETCAVVSERMELVYLNRAGRDLGEGDWFGKRCFEVLPVTDVWCALHCPTIKAVNESNEIAYCEERFQGEDGSVVNLGGAIIPLTPRADRKARALLLLRRKPGIDVLRRKAESEAAGFRERLLADASALRRRITARLA